MSSAVPAVALTGPSKAPEYWFDTWHVQDLWGAGARGGGVTIGLLDTGVNGKIAELGPKLLPGRDFVTDGDGHVDHQVAGPDDDPRAEGHGTAMASIMVADTTRQGVVGLAPDAKILPVALPLGPLDKGSGDHLAEGLIWAVDHGAKIINMSFGGARDPKTVKQPCDLADQAAIDYAVGKGVIVVAAGGNSNEDKVARNPVEDPGVCLGVVSVGAVDKRNQATGFSSRHPYLTLSAPGENVAAVSKHELAYSGSGTSQAAAIASAAFALIWSKFPDRTGRQILSMALSTLDRKSSTRHPAYGYGTINPQRAIASGDPAAPNPVFDDVQPFVEQDRAKQEVSLGNAPGPMLQTPDPGAQAIAVAPRRWSAPVLRGVVLAIVGFISMLILVTGSAILQARRRDAGEFVDADDSLNGESSGPDDESRIGWQMVTGPGTTLSDKRGPFSRRK